MRNSLVKKGLVFVIIVLFIGAVVLPVSGTVLVRKTSNPLFNGNILYVGGTGPGNYTKIQDAIDDANDGDTVFVYSGCYDESLTVPVTITLQGEFAATTTISGIAYKDVIEVSADSVTITGFTITSPDVEWWLKGVYIGGNNTEISYNIIENLGYGIEEFVSFDGANHSIHHNIIKDNYWGIEFYGVTKTRIFNNSFDNRYGGLLLCYSDYNIIFNNRFFDSCLDIMDSYNNIVYNNTINGKPIIYLENEKNKVIEYAGQVLLFNCKYITIKNCYFNEPYYSIHLCATKHCKIINNTFTELSGCYFDYTWDTIVKGNSFNLSGIQGWQCVNTVIKYNNFTNCYYALLFEYGNLCTRIIRNNFINNVRDLLYLWSYFCTVRQNYWDEPRILPKIIRVGDYEYGYQENRILIDWFPAWKPNDIGVLNE